MTHIEQLTGFIGESFRSLSSGREEEIGDERVQGLKVKLYQTKVWIGIKGQRMDYPKETDFPTGYLKELEIETPDRGTLRAGMDVLDYYPPESVYAYINFSNSSGLVRFIVYNDWDFILTIEDENGRDVQPIERPLDKMRAKEYDVVMGLFHLLKQRVDDGFITRETTADSG